MLKSPCLTIVGIGLYYGYRDRHAKDTDTFLLGGRRLPLVPVVLSLFVGWMTSIAFIGDPVEVCVYTYSMLIKLF